MTTTIDNYYKGLTDEQILSRCPAVFADRPHEAVSSKYLFIATSDILARMRQRDLVPTSVSQTGSSIQEHTRHLLRFRHSCDLNMQDGECPEILIFNSGDTTGSYQVKLGYFRAACANGCVTGNSLYHFRIVHMGSDNLLTRVMEATEQIIALEGQMMQSIGQMKDIILSPEEKRLFAKAVIDFRFNVPDLEKGQQQNGNGQYIPSGPVVDALPNKEREQKPVLYQSEDFLQTRIKDDMKPVAGQRYLPYRSECKDDLFTTMQTLQGNTIKGGVVHYERGMRQKSRKITDIQQNLRMNIAVSKFADELVKLHGGK